MKKSTLRKIIREELGKELNEEVSEQDLKKFDDLWEKTAETFRDYRDSVQDVSKFLMKIGERKPAAKLQTQLAKQERLGEDMAHTVWHLLEKL